MPYKPIESYGVIGDLHSAALVANDGSIDWCCLPHFDSPSVFAAILDERKGGYFKIAVQRDSSHRQLYLPETNILITRFLSEEGVGEVVDFMPIVPKGRAKQHEIIRIVHSVRGTLPCRLDCKPAYDYARASHETVVRPNGAVFRCPGADFALLSEIPLTRDEGGVFAEFTLEPGQRAVFAFRRGEPGQGRSLLENPTDGEEALNQTTKFWRKWLSKGRYEGRWREMVERSALALKLLTFEPTGAIVAAPTCSLPEEIGGVRNWDYRYTWIRDAAFTIYAFLRLGFDEEAHGFMHWLQTRVQEKDAPTGPLQIMYRIDGSPEIPETDLSHLEGYRGSTPVRIGNAAAEQLQLDIYGELIDSIYLYDKYVTPVSYDQWTKIRSMLRWVARHWESPDEGIWEVRGGRRQFVYSKMQCWVALDRGLRLALKRGLPNNREWLRSTPRPYLRIDHEERLERTPPVVRAVLRRRGARREQLADALGALRVADRPAHARDARPHLRGTGFRLARLPVRDRGRSRGRPERLGGHLQRLHVLAGGIAGPRGTHRRRPADLREDADLRQSPGPVRGADRPERPSAR